MRLSARVVMLAALVLGCAGYSIADPGEGEQRITGTVLWYEFEGGFYGIRGDDAVSYEPINLPEEFSRHGLRVVANVRVREDLGSFRMVGPVIEIVTIRRR